MERELVREKHVMRYASADDFGLPVTAFLICRFWLIDAWWSLGRREEARDLFVDALAHRNRYGLLSEDVDPQTGALWGNFPQTYSMAGLILTAMRCRAAGRTAIGAADRRFKSCRHSEPRWHEPGRRTGRCRAFPAQAQQRTLVRLERHGFRR